MAFYGDFWLPTQSWQCPERRLEWEGGVKEQPAPSPVPAAQGCRDPDAPLLLPFCLLAAFDDAMAEHQRLK